MALAETFSGSGFRKLSRQLKVDDLGQKALHVVSPDDASSGQDGVSAAPRMDPAVFLEEGLAAAALAMEDYRAVARHCSQLVQICPTHFEAWFNLGMARQQTGEIEEAIFAYHQAARLAPHDPRPFVNLAIARHNVDDLEGAKDAYRGALALDAGLPQALWNLALILDAQDDPEQAAELVARFVQVKSDMPEAWFRHGEALLARQDYKSALDAFQQTLRLLPDLEAAMVNAAICFMKTGQVEEARSVLGDMLDRHPDSAEALNTIAATCVETGDWELGLAVRKRLQELRCACPELTYNLAVVSEEQNRIDDAIRLYCEALRENPRFPEALLNLGHLLHRQGKHVEATECWKRALALSPELARGYFEPEEV